MARFTLAGALPLVRSAAAQLKLIDKYSRKRVGFVSMNGTFVRARMMWDRFARHSGGMYHPAPYRGPTPYPALGQTPPQLSQVQRRTPYPAQAQAQAVPYLMHTSSGAVPARRAVCPAAAAARHSASACAQPARQPQ
ncbi:hypothetical protein C8R47DRAFT_115223 [Mycena vitilis]|nr:hypothetical protein C8R47DRAFT_115223 [Mycena vitilis]